MNNTLARLHRNALLFAAVCLGSVATVPALAGSFCGNGLLDLAEQCDDGNAIAGDGCDFQCQVEPGYQCTQPFQGVSGNSVLNGGFEDGDNDWVVSSDNTEVIFCNSSDCTNHPGSRYGAGWLRLTEQTESGISVVAQEVTIPSGSSELRFDLMQHYCSTLTGDVLQVSLDGNGIFLSNSLADICGEDHYTTQRIDLQTAVGGPYDDDQPHSLTFGAFTLEPGVATVFSFDNVIIGEPTGTAQPSVCTLDNLTLSAEDFDPPVAGDLSSLDITLIELGDPIPWGTTDDGVCGQGVAGPGNFTGGPGEAACLDASVFGGANIQSFFCLPTFDFESIFQPTLEFLLNFQPGNGNGEFIVLAGVGPATPGTIGGFAIVDQYFDPVGVLGEPPGELISIRLDNFIGQPEVTICFGFLSENAFYAQVDSILLSYTDCTQGSDDDDKIQQCLDNCTGIDNFSQADSDGDGYGNACDADIYRPSVSGEAGRAEAGNGNDCFVNLFDLVTFKDAFAATTADSNWNPDADFNDDRVVNLVDLITIKALFFAAPGPSGTTSVCQLPPEP